jgi:V/A-type H+-transporting ATPase subunit E
MEIQLQELIDQIKKNGVEAAETEAIAITDAAKAEAQKIIADAQAQAEKILASAKAENDRIVRSGEDAIRQAGRNLLISFRESVTRELEVILAKNVSDVYSSEAFSKLIVSVIEAWSQKPEADDISVILNTKDLEALEECLLASVKDKMLSGVTLKANDNFDGGFRIAVNEGSAYYDYSTDSVVEMLSNYLSPKVAKLLKEAE